MYHLHCLSPCRVRAEPRLGFNWIASAERNAWNDVLSRVLSDKVATWIFVSVLNFSIRHYSFCLSFHMFVHNDV